MPKSKYEFIKIELRLFEDPRFFMLCEFDQLNYIKLLVLAKRTKNYIKKDYIAIGKSLRTEQTPSSIRVSIKRIMSSFQPEGKRRETSEPTICQNRYYFWFSGWDERYSYGGVEKEKEIEKEKEKTSSFNKTKRYFKGEEMRFSKNKWWVLPKDGGKWLEFGGDLKDTELRL